jgi:2-polyprenyl-3-methyl-5-hydroxy-6-metoxy-1,4-benzoquinol methylase
MKKNKQLKKIYNNIFATGEEKIFTRRGNSGEILEIKNVVSQVSWKGKKVIDVGCGTGHFAHIISKKGANVLGIDFSEEAIKIAQGKYKHKNLSYEHVDLEKGIQGKFDVIVSLGTIEHQDKPLEILKDFKKHLNVNGKIILTVPNWTNPRGYILMSLYYLFDAPITLADLHYFTPLTFTDWSKKMNMVLKWKTFDRTWASGEILLKDFSRRLPNVLRDAGLPIKKKNIDNLLNWLETEIIPLNHKSNLDGAMAVYVLSKKSNRNRKNNE